MESGKVNRRGFLGRLGVVLGGLAAIPAMSGSAEAGRSRRRGWGRGWSSHRRGYGYRPYGSGYGPYGYGGYGYRPYGYGYGGGYVAPPVYRGYYYPPAAPVYPGVAYPPLMQRQGSPLSDALSLLEA
jgi:hypothetical protein